MAPFQCDYGYQISVGARTFINYGAIVLDAATVTIGDDVQIGPGVQLLTALHPLESEPRRRGVETAAPVAIADGAWLAAGVIVLPWGEHRGRRRRRRGQRRHEAICRRVTCASETPAG